MLEIKPFVECYIRYNIQSCLVTQACAQNAGNEKTPHFQPRIMWAAIPLFVRQCVFCCLAPLGLASQYPQSTIAISVISNICDICDTTIAILYGFGGLSLTL